MIEWRTLGSFSILDLTTNKYKRPKKVSFFMPKSPLFVRFTKHQRISCSDFWKIFYKFKRNSLLTNKKSPFCVLNSYFMLVFQYEQYNYRFIWN